MTKMTAAEAAICVLEKEGLLQTFGVPGAAINPFYAAMKKRDTVKHILVGTLKVPRTWPRVTPGPRLATLVCVLGRLAQLEQI